MLAVDPAGPVTLAWVAQGNAPGDPTQIDYVVGDGALSSRQTLPAALTGDEATETTVTTESGGDEASVTTGQRAEPGWGQLGPQWRWRARLDSGLGRVSE